MQKEVQTPAHLVHERCSTGSKQLIFGNIVAEQELAGRREEKFQAGFVLLCNSSLPAIGS